MLVGVNVEGGVGEFVGGGVAVCVDVAVKVAVGGTGVEVLVLVGVSVGGGVEVFVGSGVVV